MGAGIQPMRARRKPREAKVQGDWRSEVLGVLGGRCAGHDGGDDGGGAEQGDDGLGDAVEESVSAGDEEAVADDDEDEGPPEEAERAEGSVEEGVEEVLGESCGDDDERHDAEEHGDAGDEEEACEVREAEASVAVEEGFAGGGGVPVAELEERVLEAVLRG
jgi:hypothetical protein